MSHLLLVSAGAVRLRYRLDGDETTIGRSPLADLFVDDPAIAPIHAVLVERDDGGHALRAGAAGSALADLADGDGFDVGPFHARYVDGERRDRQREPQHADGGTWDEGLPVASYDGLLTSSADFFRWIARLELDAHWRDPMVFVGEPGTGKSRFARAAHRRARGWPYRLAAVDCASLPAGQAEAALDAAGTLVPRPDVRPLVKEAQALPLALQRRLARAVLGRPRVYFTFRQSPADLHAEGRLHRDLFVALQNVYDLPPLRARGRDAEAIFEVLLAQLAPGVPPVIEPSARERLALHPWPGNVRELKNAAQRLVLSGARTVGAADLPLDPAPARASA